MNTTTLERPTHTDRKVARYGWKTVSDKGEFYLIDKSALKANTDDYQRISIAPKVAEFTANWSWISCGVIIVARRGLDLWVVDGLHRKTAADRRSDITDLPCLVFDVEDVAGEARAFLSTNRNRKPMTALAAFKAEITAGDEIAIFVRDAIANSGLKISKASLAPGDFKAIALARDLATRDRGAFVETLNLAASLALAEGAPLHKRVLGGLFYINRRIPLSTPRLRKRIEQIGIAALLRSIASATAFYGRAGEKVCAEGIMQAVNKGLQKKFELAA